MHSLASTIGVVAVWVHFCIVVMDDFDMLEIAESSRAATPVASPSVTNLQVSSCPSMRYSVKRSQEAVKSEPVKMEARAQASDDRPTEDFTTPPTKRQRISQKSAGFGVAKSFVDADETTSEFGIVEARHSEEEEEQKTCTGCQRSSTGQDWLTGFPICWALPGHRGLWCKDCFNCWRLMYASEATLLVFGNWLLQKKNFDSWELTMCAYLSLKKEGHNRVTQALVQTRESVLKWVIQLLNLVPNQGIIVKLSDMDPSSALDPTRLLTMLGSDKKLSLSYLQEGPADLESHAILRPQHSHRSFPWRQRLFTQECKDLDRLRSKFPDDEIAPEQQLAVNDSQSFPHETGKHSKIASLVEWGKSQLSTFATESWQSLKESSFTAAFNKFAVLKAEVANEGNDKVVVVCEEWNNALAQVKMFIRKYKGYLKCNKKVGALMAMSPAIDLSAQFVQSKGFELHHSLATLRMKVAILCSKKKTWSAIFDEIVELGLQKVCASMPTSSSVTAEGVCEVNDFQSCVTRHREYGCENLRVEEI
jgi:hypothetical protein